MSLAFCRFNSSSFDSKRLHPSLFLASMVLLSYTVFSKFLGFSPVKRASTSKQSHFEEHAEPPIDEAMSTDVHQQQWQRQPSSNPSNVASPASTASLASLDLFALDSTEEGQSKEQSKEHSNTSSPPLFMTRISRSLTTSATAQGRFSNLLPPQQLSAHTVATIITTMSGTSLNLESVLMQLGQWYAPLAPPPRHLLLRTLLSAEQLLLSTIPGLATVWHRARQELESKRPHSLPDARTMQSVHRPAIQPVSQPYTMNATSHRECAVADGTDDWDARSYAPNDGSTVAGQSPGHLAPATMAHLVSSRFTTTHLGDNPEAVPSLQTTMAVPPSLLPTTPTMGLRAARTPSPVLQTQTGAE
jgi:hypothetical protein